MRYKRLKEILNSVYLDGQGVKFDPIIANGTVDIALSQIKALVIRSLGEKKEGIEIKGAAVKCEFPDDCNFPICICSETEPTKNIYVPVYNRGYNQHIDEIKEKWSGGEL